MKSLALAHWWIRELRACGLREVVVSPGSRSAPLILALESEPKIALYVQPDERSAAFLALGLSRQAGRPVGLVCTSGSAGLNYAPALAEAYQQGVSLLAITADRPLRFVGAYEGQTLWQEEFYAGFIKGRMAVCESNPGNPKEAWALSTQGMPGPVHINMRFEEPLYGGALEQPIEPTLSQALFSRFDFGQTRPLDALKTLDLPARPKAVVLAGHMGPQQAQALLPWILEFKKRGGLFWGDVSSQLWPYSSQAQLPDWLWEQTEEKNRPQLLVSMGGSVIPRRWEAYFERFPNQTTVHVDLFGEKGYRFRPDGWCWTGSPAGFFESLPQEMEALNCPAWNAEPGGGWSDVTATAELLRGLPGDSVFHLANSMGVRYVHALQDLLPKGIELWCNRGVSGIDGTLSTAVGQALAQPNKWHVVLMGDLALNYDCNAMLSQPRPNNLGVVVLNNGGGQIFRNLPGPKSRSMDAETYFVAGREGDFEWLARRNAWAYHCVQDLGELRAFLHQSKGIVAGLLEIKTEAQANTEAWAGLLSERRAAWNQAARGRD